MKKTLLTIMISGILAYSFASEEKPNTFKVCESADAPHYQNTITAGVAGGIVYGYGLNYRQWFEKNGFQVTIFPKISISEDDKDINVVFGVNWMHAIWESRMREFGSLPARTLVFTYLGGRIGYMGYSYKGMDGTTITTDGMEEITPMVGGGAGLQFNISAVQLSLGLGFAGGAYISRDLTSNRYVNTDHSWETDYALNPTIDASLGYTFGW